MFGQERNRSSGQPLKDNLAFLDGRYLTRNGYYFFYSVIWEKLQQGFDYLNLIPNVSIPRDPLSLTEFSINNVHLLRRFHGRSEPQRHAQRRFWERRVLARPA